MEFEMVKTRLFTVTQWLLNAAMLVCAFGGAVLCVALGALAIMATGLWMPPEVPAQVKGVPVSHVFLIVALAMLAGIAILALAILIFRAVRQIVDSAVSGDPFVVENADRLARIGWLLLGVYGVQFVAGAMVGVIIPAQLKDDIKFDGFGGFNFSPLGILAILLIFVLAQIFRHGSEMRAELEGTV
jgi:hypothetical protein